MDWRWAPARCREVDSSAISFLGLWPHPYRRRWTIETAFAKLTQDLRCELHTLGYPQAALFSFCVVVVMYNALSTVLAALRVTHPKVATSQSRTSGKERIFSFYYLTDEISGVSRGMAIAIPAELWTAAFANLTTKQMAKKLLWLARRVDVKPFLTNPYGTKVRTKKAKKATRGGHVSIYRILQKQKNQKKKIVMALIASKDGDATPGPTMQIPTVYFAVEAQG